MYKSICTKNAKKLALYSLGFFLVIVTNMGCGSSYVTTTTFRESTSMSLSRLEGQTNKYFSSRLIVTSNFLTDLKVLSIDGLPPGVVLNSNRNTIEGTPTKAGFYNITITYNDKNKGTYMYGPGNSFFTYNGEISIYDKLN